jgi:hypothetical protein
MKPSFTRRLRRKSKPAKNEGAFFKKESSAEHSFFCEASHGAFFQPAVSNGQVVQRKCTCCDHSGSGEKEEQKVQRAVMNDKKEEDDKKLQRAPEKKEEDDKKLMRASASAEASADKEEDKKLQRAPEKKEEDDKKLQRATDKKEEDDKKLMRAEAPKKDDEDKKLQKKEGGATPAASHVGGYVGSLNGKGHSLPPLANQFFSERMGYDFSQVKVHTDKNAAESAKSVNAKAYAIGNNIVFNEGQYDPGSQEGKRLLAHELTHVVQQKATEEGEGTDGAIQRAVNYVTPTYTKGDPIRKILSGASSKLGETFIVINGQKLRTKEQAVKAVFEAFNNNLGLQYDAKSKTCKVDTSKVILNVSADIAILTDPVNDKWSGQYPGSLVAGSATCSKLATVNIQLISTPSGGAALQASVSNDEEQHCQDIMRLAKQHFEPFLTYLQNISLSVTSEADCQTKFNAEMGSKDIDMARAFANDWLAAVNRYDNPTGTHHYKSVTNPGTCNPVTITVSF